MSATTISTRAGAASVIMAPTLRPAARRCRERIGHRPPARSPDGLGETAPVTEPLTATPAEVDGSRGPRRRVPLDPAVAVALYLLAAAVNLASVVAVGPSLVLMG